MSRTVLCSRASKPYPLFPKTCSKPDVHRRTKSGGSVKTGAQLHLILGESDVGALMRQHASPIGVAASSRSAEDYGPTSVQVGFPRGDSGGGAAYMWLRQTETARVELMVIPESPDLRKPNRFRRSNVGIGQRDMDLRGVSL